MKRKILFVPLVLMGLFVVLTFGCDGDDSPIESCTDFTACGETAKACCTPTKCHYEYNGQDYNCDGVDCNDAAIELTADMCSTSGNVNKSANIEVLNTTQNMLNKVRMSTLCN